MNNYQLSLTPFTLTPFTLLVNTTSEAVSVSSDAYSLSKPGGYAEVIDSVIDYFKEPAVSQLHSTVSCDGKRCGYQITTGN